MITDKIVDKLVQLERAHNRFSEVLKDLDNPLVIDASIQRFEFTYELVWKVLKLHLENNGLFPSYPKEVLSLSFEHGLIDDNDLWKNIILFRNQTVHTYNEKMAKDIFIKLPEYSVEFNKLIVKLIDIYK